MQVIGLVICRTMDWYINLWIILNSYLKIRGCEKTRLSFLHPLLFMDISNYSDPHIYVLFHRIRNTIMIQICHVCSVRTDIHCV